MLVGIILILQKLIRIPSRGLINVAVLLVFDIY